VASDNETGRYKTLTRRTAMLAGGQLTIVAVLVGRMYYLQVVESNQYQMMADENRIDMRLLPPLRGRILDRFGQELASNRQNFRAILIPEQTDEVEETLDALARVVPFDDHQKRKVLREIARRRPFVPVTVVENLTWEQFAAVNVHGPELSGIQPEVGETRYYPYADQLAHVIGYVAAVAESEVDDDPLLQLPGFRIGKNGIERAFDKRLRGTAGSSRVEVNAYGRMIRELQRREGEPGDEVIMTLDMGLQRFAYDAMGQESGAAVVMDVHTGEVLALASTPGFDPNLFNTGLSHAEWNSLRTNERNPLINKPIAGLYPPGSTFKMMTALAGLESRIVTADHPVFCSGVTSLGNHEFHCWKKEGHGTVDMLGALEGSCDLYFYDVARRVGIDRIAEMCGRFGLGRPTGIELPNEWAGIIPSTQWKLQTMGKSWQQGETLVAGIGQGYITTTPLQLAQMVSRIANGGHAVSPRLVRSAGTTEFSAGATPSLGISPANLATVIEGMNRVTNSPTGTAFKKRISEPGWEMAGKTGTAQVRRITMAERAAGVRKQEDKPWIERHHALFVGFAPVSAPRYAVSVIVEHGGSGSGAAAPVARDLLREAQRLDPLSRQAVSPTGNTASGPS
jgi:penicillin-binding protein 2